MGCRWAPGPQEQWTPRRVGALPHGTLRPLVASPWLVGEEELQLVPGQGHGAQGQGWGVGQGGAGQGASLLSWLTVHRPSQAALLLRSACRCSWGQGPRMRLPPRPAVRWWELLGGGSCSFSRGPCLHVGHQGWRGETAGRARSACRRGAPAVAPQPEVDTEPSPDLLGSILSGQSLLMMNGADIIIHRDGSLSAKRAGEQLCPRPPAALRTPRVRATRPGGSLCVADPAALGFTLKQWVRVLKAKDVFPSLADSAVGGGVSRRPTGPPCCGTAACLLSQPQRPAQGLLHRSGPRRVSGLGWIWP